MNRKFFILAFISAAFFFGCSADGQFPEGHPENAVWSKDLQGPIGPGTGPGTGGGSKCSFMGQCLDIPDDVPSASVCQMMGGTVTSCN